MSSIDERVVAMKFDNAQFTRGVSETNQSLDKLKQGLNLDASARSLQGLQDAGNRFSLASIASSVESLSSKFSAMGVVGITALMNITNRAIDAGVAFSKSFTVDPIMDGFNEYETKLGSIQTILANTAKDGTTLEQVSAALGELNTYSDKTIYNFGDMTRNIGLFTNAGIGLQDATDMIKGFSNEAAMSGTTSANAAGAAYQLSQALSKGKITLEDWKSLTNVGMGNANMKAGIIDIAEAMGTMKKAGVSAKTVNDDFNGSLEKGWMTAAVMQNYLKIQAGEMNAEQMKSMGLNQKQIDNFIKMQKIAEDSATKVRTWTQLVGTLKESIGSSWAATAELLIGDFNEATELFTNVNNTLGDLIGKAGDARNNLLKGWIDLGGRKVLIDAIALSFDALMNILKVVHDAFVEIFPPVTAQQLFDLTQKILAFAKALRPSAEQLDLLKRTFKGVFAVLDIGWLIVQKIWGVFERLFKSMDGGGTSILQITARIGDFLVNLRNTLVNSDKLNEFFFKFGEALKIPIKFITELIGKIPALMDQLPALFDKIKSWKPDFGPFGAAVANLVQSIEKLRPTGEGIKKIWEGLINVFKKALEIGQKMAGALGEAFKGLGSGMQDATKDVDFNTILGILGVGVGGAGFMGIIKVIKKFKDAIVGAIESIGEGGGLMDTIKEAFGGLTETLSNMQQTLKASTLILLAGAIALLAGAMMTLSKIDAAKLPAVLGAMTVMMIQLGAAMAVLDKLTIGASVGNMVAIGVAMVLLAIAIKILASALEDMSKLSWDEILKGLAAVTGMLIGLAIATRIMGTQNGTMIQTGIGLMAVAVAIKILASACADFSKLSWDEIARGLTGVGTVLGALALFTRLAKVNKGAVAQAGGLILLGVALKIMASAVNDFANLNPATIQQGLGALTGVLMVLAGFTQIVKPQGMIGTATAMVILGGALKIMATAVQDFGNISWEVLGRGLAGMAGALVSIGIAMRIMPGDMVSKSVALVIVAGALEILADVLKKLGGMSIEEMAKGLSTLAVSLMLIATALMVMENALPGAFALIIAAGALTLLAQVLITLGNLPIPVIITGLATLAAALTLLGVAALILTPVIPALMGLGIAIGLLGAGAALAGIGMLAFATGLTVLAAAGAGAATVLIAVVTGLLGLLPYAFTQVGLAIVALAQVLGSNVQTFVTLGVNLLTGLLDGLRTVLPNVISFVVDMIIMLLTFIANNIQNFVDVGMRIIVGFINGIAGQIGNVVNAAVNLIVNFLNGIANNIGRIIEAGANIIIAFIQGIGKQAGRLAQEGYNTIITFVNSLADTIRNNQARMNSAGNNLAGAIIDGMTSGIRNGISAVADAARNVAQGALDTVKGWLGIHSPSREFKKLGLYSSEGLALGISGNGDMVNTASEAVARDALNTMADTLARLDAEMDQHMALNPVITPVLDLSSVQAQAASLTGMLAVPTLTVDQSYANARALSAQYKQNQDSKAKTSDVSGTDGEQGLTFIQNNYSPKALTNAEIYRKTNNQLSRIKKG